MPQVCRVRSFAGALDRPAAIEAEIAHLRSLAIDALRRRWRVMFGRTPPAALSKDLLGRMIAGRLQEQAFGGLDRESRKFLDGLGNKGTRRGVSKENPAVFEPSTHFSSTVSR
jgi:hypothetical protein